MRSQRISNQHRFDIDSTRTCGVNVDPRVFQSILQWNTIDCRELGVQHTEDRKSGHNLAGDIFRLYTSILMCKHRLKFCYWWYNWQEVNNQVQFLDEPATIQGWYSSWTHTCIMRPQWGKIPWISFISDLHIKLSIISRSVPGLATDFLCCVWGHGWITCLMYHGPVDVWVWYSGYDFSIDFLPLSLFDTLPKFCLLFCFLNDFIWNNFLN